MTVRSIHWLSGDYDLMQPMFRMYLNTLPLVGTADEIVQLNREIILFAYGLVFFVLGLAILFQSRRYSRLDLARSLSWLAGFGLLHGLYEWGELFSPFQERYLARPAILLLHVTHLIFFGLSVLSLFEFGMALLREGMTYVPPGTDVVDGVAQNVPAFLLDALRSVIGSGGRTRSRARRSRHPLER